jgi:hypothetical protein
MPCYLTRTDLLQGEYLRRYPRGRHVDAAIDRVLVVTTFPGDPPKLDHSGLPRAEVCGDLARALAPLKAAVAGSNGTRRDAAAAALDGLAALCR